MDSSDRLEVFLNGQENRWCAIVSYAAALGRVTAVSSRLHRTPAVNADNLAVSLLPPRDQHHTPGPGDVSRTPTRVGVWYWMRSPELRAAGGRHEPLQPVLHSVPRSGWPGASGTFPTSPIFTNTTSGKRRVLIRHAHESFWEGRGAVIPLVPGHSDAGRIGRDGLRLHSGPPTVPGTEVSRPDLGEAGTGNKACSEQSEPLANERCRTTPLPPVSRDPPTRRAPSIFRRFSGVRDSGTQIGSEA